MRKQLLSALLAGTTLAVSSHAVMAETVSTNEQSSNQDIQDVHNALEEVIVVTARARDKDLTRSIAGDAAPLMGADIAKLTARTPGMARIGNGAISGQVQFRGLFGERMNLRVDGQRFGSGGPNLMDPVFHYAPAPLVAAVKIDRGVSPVSAGTGLSGGADAIFKKIDYTKDTKATFGYDLSAATRTVNDSVEVGGVIGLSTDKWRFNLIGSFEDGNDSEFKGGTIAGTFYRRSVYGLSAGVKTDIGDFSLDARRQNTDPSGNAPFPMDIQYFNTNFAKLGYGLDMGTTRLDAKIYYTKVDHLMDNFSARPAPMPMRFRATFAKSETQGAEVKITTPVADGTLKIGADAERRTHNARITNPNNDAFFVTPFPDIENDRFGAFAEWTGPVGPVMAEIGLRTDINDLSAGEATLGAALPMGPRMLANAFNQADRQQEDTTWDAVIRLWTPEKNGLSWRAALARKQQMPGYIQRFGWLPINASGGLADGNIYVGDLTVTPETAWSADIGFDYNGDNFYIRPTVFIRQIDDYIQGVPFDDTVGVINSPVEIIANMNGDPTPLRWDNVDARLFGADLDMGYDFNGPLRLDAVASFVRGERRDIDDHLYRIAPPSLTVAMTYEADAWSLTFESKLVAKQNKTSATNSETASKGYEVFHLYGNWRVANGITLSAGIENLFDVKYQDHLSGINRNGFGDAPLGERLPGEGRGGFLRLNVSY